MSCDSEVRTVEDAVEVLEALERRELAAERLFESFVRHVPERADLWRRVADARAADARILKALGARAREGAFALSPGALEPVQTIADGARDLELYLRHVHERGVTMQRAAAVAKEVDRSLRERSVAAAVESDDPGVARMAARLHANAAAYREQLDALPVARDEQDSLVERGFVNNVQLEIARALGRKERVSVESILIGRFGVPKDAVLAGLSAHHGVRPYSFEGNVALPPAVRAALDGRDSKLRSKRFAPVAEESGRIVVAAENPSDILLRDDVQRWFPGQAIEYRVAIPEDVLGAIDLIFHGEKKGDSLRTILRELSTGAEDAGALDLGDDYALQDDTAVVRLINVMIEDAYSQGASDIHIEPSADGGVFVRYRVDGVLRRTIECPRPYRRSIISRVKIMSGLDVAEHRRPQSGKIRFKRWGRLDVELRVETYPTVGDNEDAVLRILAAGKPKPVTELGLSASNLTALLSAIKKPYGLFLCVGPTGSGKTTTLHSALGHINDNTLKIVTAEDPVEITQPGLRQLQVNRKAGVSFADALRSFLRADPDVIMIGEMRDLETAEAAVEASLTGHLVLSTLHTNNAPETATRLLDMGVDPYAFADALLGVLAQRLVRRLCHGCRRVVRNAPTLRREMRREFADDAGFDALLASRGDQPPLFEPVGCDGCGGSGYRGRAAVHELMVVTDSLREAILHRENAGKIRDLARSEGMRTLKQDGIEKVLDGITTLDEVLAASTR